MDGAKNFFQVADRLPKGIIIEPVGAVRLLKHERCTRIGCVGFQPTIPPSLRGDRKSMSLPDEWDSFRQRAEARVSLYRNHSLYHLDNGLVLNLCDEGR